ncbi:MAG: hypothetical protein WAP35_10455 [Solirubrobacterales bacterium]
MEEQNPDFMERARARTEAKNQTAREQLVPLEPGERPRAVTIAAIAAMALAIGNLIAFLVGSDDVEDTGQAAVQLGFICGILALASIGMWLAKYWAVLGFQTILGLQIIIYALSLTRVESAWVALLLVAIIGASGTLFWFLIRAMARIQMPESPEAKAAREAVEAQAGDESAGEPADSSGQLEPVDPHAKDT